MTSYLPVYQKSRAPDNKSETGNFSMHSFKNQRNVVYAFKPWANSYVYPQHWLWHGCTHNLASAIFIRYLCYPVTYFSRNQVCFIKSEVIFTNANLGWPMNWLYMRIYNPFSLAVILTKLLQMTFENIVTKEEIAHHEQFLL